MRAAWLVAWARLRAARRRSLATAMGVFAAATLLGAAVTVGYGLNTGFDRAAARADLPDIVARFDQRGRAEVDRRVRALPGVQARAYRFEALHVPLAARGHRTPNGSIAVVGSGRRGYGVVDGRDVSGSAAQVVVERGLAQTWDLHVGDALLVGRLGSLRIAGIAVAPDNVAFPLATTAHLYLAGSYLDARFGRERPPMTNVALVWLHEDAAVSTVLQQARASAYGISGLRFLTRRGVRVALDEAGGIVVALLGAVSLVGLIAAGILLGAGAQADVQRGLATIGIQRAIGLTPGAVAAGWALAGLAVALPAGAAGLGVGTALAYGPTGGLLTALNELAPGTALIGPLALALIGLVALVAICTAWPAWRAAHRAPVALLRGAELSPARSLRGLPVGPGMLGMRLVAARRMRALTTTGVLAVTGSVLLVMLALGSLLAQLRDDPGALGKRYEISVALAARRAPEVARITGVLAAAPRYAVEGIDSFSLGEPLRVIAYPGDHTRFEAAPLAEGHRLRTDGQAEVGQGLADALGLHLGGTLAVQLPGGREARFRVAGIVRALDHDGRVVYVRAAALLRTESQAPAVVVVRLAPGADQAAVRRAITARTGVAPGAPSTSTTRNRRFLGTLSALVRAIAGVIAIVCLYALVQALAILAREQRSTIAVLRASGAGIATVGRLLTGAALAVAIPGVLAALALERAVLGPGIARLAAGYAELSLVPTASQVVLFVAGFGVLGAAAGAWVALATRRESIVAGLRSQ